MTNDKDVYDVAVEYLISEGRNILSSRKSTTVRLER